MLRLTQGVGLTVTTAGGTRLGVVRDLAVRAGSARPPVTQVLFGEPDRPTSGLPWSTVTAMTATGVTVRDDVILRPLDEGTTIGVEDDELLLTRDVLDTQVVDVRGRFLVRVADVPLILDLSGAGDEPDGLGGDIALVATGVELSAAGRLSRVGFERLGGRRGQRFVPWSDLHLTSVRGRAALMATHSPLFDLPASELARILPKLSSAHGGELLRHLTPEVFVATVKATSQSDLRRLLTGLPPDLVDRVLAAMAPSRAATMRRTLPDISAARTRLMSGHRHR